MQKPVSFKDDIKLQIYKASAGSGKTHKITEEYLLLLLNPNTPFSYRNILAVTFTNKATDEMKTRIIHELAQLAKGADSPYLKILSSTYNKNEIQIRELSRDVLTRILHDYSSFSVSTIDKFFQQTMRAFTRELGIDGNYGIELDANKVLIECIDNLLGDLEKKENQLLLAWLIKFTEEKVEDGRTWNIKSDILNLSREIFKEDFKANREFIQQDISNKELLQKYKEALGLIIFGFENNLKQLGKKGIDIIESHGLLLENFKGGKRTSFNFLVKLYNKEVSPPTPTFCNFRDEIENWYAKTCGGDIKEKIHNLYPLLNAVISEILDIFENQSIEYQTAKEINRYFFTLGILGDIDLKVREYSTSNNLLLISDTTELLNKIIDGSDTPFIYEKVGQYINHYMIDEFQDTSGMQWQNFRPLLKDSLAQGYKNFVVGDVKQSIYRWRNSDWTLLDSQLDIDFEKEGVNHETLFTNWRSTPNVILFNNTIFESGSRILQTIFDNSQAENTIPGFAKFKDKITTVFNDVVQEIPTKSKDETGEVKVEFINTEEHPEWEEYVLEQLPKEIETLQDKGFRLKDIAILVRTKREGALVANCLLDYKKQHANSKYKFDIISDEALYISSSQSIKLIIALLNYILTPHDASLKSLATCEYLKFKEQLQDQEAILKYFSEGYEFPEEILSRLENIKKLSLYEMIESLFELFSGSINTNEQIYIQSFMDLALDYSNKHSTDIMPFLKWWNEVGTHKTVFTPDAQDAIKIMTIHKSKGLGFEAVIIPFCNWEIDHKLEVILWCKPTTPPFNNIHILPVRYSKKLLDTYFVEEYYNERLHAFIDNINVLYVAFTRAKRYLTVFAPKVQKKEASNISALLYEIITNRQNDIKENCMDLSQFFNEQNDSMKIGEGYIFRNAKQTKAESEISTSYFPSISFDNRLELQLSNKYFFSETGQRDYGNLLHKILSSITIAEDIEPALNRHVITGEIDKEEKENVKEMLLNFLSQEPVKSWFSNNYKTLNEVEILLPNGKYVRPDRVMIDAETVFVIDYKFGSIESPQHVKQIKYYMSQIQKMGYETVKGYLCYVKLNRITEVSEK